VSLPGFLAWWPYSDDSQVLCTSTSSHQLLVVTSGAPTESGLRRVQVRGWVCPSGQFVDSRGPGLAVSRS
jgi:hypothetical protein